MAATTNPIVLALSTATPVRSTDDYVVAGRMSPLMRQCRSVTLQLLTSGATVNVGLQKPTGVAGNVSATVYNVVLNDANPSVTLGLGSDNNDVDLGDTYLFSDTASAKVAVTPEIT